MPNHDEVLQKLAANELENLELVHAYGTYNFIPKCLELLKTNISLKSLDLRDTSLLKDDFELLIEALAQNPRLPLQRLNVSASHLGSGYISHHVRPTSYRIDRIKKLIEVLATNTHLEELDLSNNALEVNDIKDIGDMLKRNKSLKKLHIQNNSCPMKPKNVNGYYLLYAQPLAEVLKENSSLEYLDISKNNISLEDLHLFAEAMETNKTLKYLFIDSTPALLESDAWKKLQQRLEANRQYQLEQVSEPERVVSPSAFNKVFSFPEEKNAADAPRRKRTKRKPLKSETFATEFLTSKRFKI